MEILGVGLPEMAFIVLIALILLGPKEMVEASRTIGKTLRKFVTSPTWKAMRTTGQELQQLPTKLMREAGLEELEQMKKEMQGMTKGLQEEMRGMTKEVQDAAYIDPRAVSVSFDEKKIFTELAPPAPAPAKPAAAPPVDAPADTPPASSDNPQA